MCRFLWCRQSYTSAPLLLQCICQSSHTQLVLVIERLFLAAFPSIIPVTRWYRFMAHVCRVVLFLIYCFCDTVSYDLFVVCEIRNISFSNHIPVSSTFFCNSFEIIQASHPCSRMGSIKHPRAPLRL